eukprot:GILJ01010045.1.p1 GENE.GILJ01010045.1~~GILJ01010045.1.p1  ORF type:complete len:1156 (-),score=172.77 GILJ01010045.1:144-3611(-)
MTDDELDSVIDLLKADDLLANNPQILGNESVRKSPAPFMARASHLGNSLPPLETASVRQIALDKPLFLENASTLVGNPDYVSLHIYRTDMKYIRSFQPVRLEKEQQRQAREKEQSLLKEKALQEQQPQATNRSFIKSDARSAPFFKRGETGNELEKRAARRRLREVQREEWVKIRLQAAEEQKEKEKQERDKENEHKAKQSREAEAQQRKIVAGLFKTGYKKESIVAVLEKEGTHFHRGASPLTKRQFYNKTNMQDEIEPRSEPRGLNPQRPSRSSGSRRTKSRLIRRQAPFSQRTSDTETVLTEHRIRARSVPPIVPQHESSKYIQSTTPARAVRFASVDDMKSSRDVDEGIVPIDPSIQSRYRDHVIVNVNLKSTTRHSGEDIIDFNNDVVYSTRKVNTVHSDKPSPDLLPLSSEHIPSSSLPIAQPQHITHAVTAEVSLLADRRHSANSQDHSRTEAILEPVVRSAKHRVDSDVDSQIDISSLAADMEQFFEDTSSAADTTVQKHKTSLNGDPSPLRRRSAGKRQDVVQDRLQNVSSEVTDLPLLRPSSRETTTKEKEKEPVVTTLSCPPVVEKPPEKKQLPGRFLQFVPFVGAMNKGPPLPADTGLYFRINHGDGRLVRWILESNGFREISGGSDWMFLWTGGSIKPYMFQTLTRYQKVNHFPRAYEVTRKDCLYRNLARMQALHGHKHFPFIPKSYILPMEQAALTQDMNRDKTELWICKPHASSRGRGVFVTNKAEEIPHASNMIVSRYISNPLLINGYKFDIRLYVAVTSFNPLRIYLYKEGFARIATVQYNQRPDNIDNRFMHLTNYSVNKHSADFVQNEDASVDDRGNKWSLAALRRWLQEEGVDDVQVFEQIQDVVIKTILSVESIVHSACQMFVPYRNNCFELFGFDILLDNTHRPWLLEVNLSPSLHCDSPLDQKIKGSMLSDLFTLTGFEDKSFWSNQNTESSSSNHNHNQTHQNNASTSTVTVHPSSSSDIVGSNNNSIAHKYDSVQHATAVPMYSPRSREGKRKKVSRKRAADDFNPSTTNSKGSKTVRSSSVDAGLTPEERIILQEVEEERARAVDWDCIFPTAKACFYAQFFEEERPLNALLAYRLFRDEYKLNDAEQEEVMKQMRLRCIRDSMYRGGGAGMRKDLYRRSASTPATPV